MSEGNGWNGFVDGGDREVVGWVPPLLQSAICNQQSDIYSIRQDDEVGHN